jgi:hypothetical protein
VHDPETWGLHSGKRRLHLERLIDEWISPLGMNLAKALLLITLVVSKEISNG